MLEKIVHAWLLYQTRYLTGKEILFALTMWPNVADNVEVKCMMMKEVNPSLSHHNGFTKYVVFMPDDCSVLGK